MFVNTKLKQNRRQTCAYAIIYIFNFKSFLKEIIGNPLVQIGMSHPTICIRYVDQEKSVA